MNELLTFSEALEKLRVIKAPTLRMWVFQKKIPVVRLGRKIAFRSEDILALIDRGYSGHVG